jgi:nucleoside-diphosphate-sugar epimerase
MTKGDAMGQSALVTGAGGFIGHHLVKYLVDKGYQVRGADIKRPEYAPTSGQEFEVLDLRRYEDCLIAARGVDEVYHLAADMGGIGYITQKHADVTPLKESDAYPADAEPGYGWEKLYGELLCRYYRDDHGLETRVARFHNIYGPEGTYDGGREKAPAAISRKVALARDGDEIEVWGDGEQTRSFTFISDCVEGIYRITHSDYPEPLNLGSDELTTINNLVDVVSAAAGKTLVKRHDLSKPQGVRGRNSDNTRSKEVLGWTPSVSIADGMAETYRWIEAYMRKVGAVPAGVG